MAGMPGMGPPMGMPPGGMPGFPPPGTLLQGFGQDIGMDGC